MADQFVKSTSSLKKAEDVASPIEAFEGESITEATKAAEKLDEGVEERNRPANDTEETISAGTKAPLTKQHPKTVYLTFDDGPSQWTGGFLDVLNEHGIQATFFMQGNKLGQSSLQPDVKRAVEEGHYVGGHSMTHDHTKLYEKRQFVPEMEETLALIHEITGTSPRLVRSPYGSVPGLNDDIILNQVVDADIKVWDWTIDSQDWKFQDKPEKVLSIIENSTTADVEVVLMHEKEQTLKILPQIITFF